MCVLTLFMFLRSENSMVTLSELYHHRLTSKIQFEPEVLKLQGYPSFSLVEFYDFTYIYVFEVLEMQWWHFQNLTTTGWPRKSSSNRKYWNFKVTHLSPLWNFMISPIFMFRGREMQWWHFQNLTTTGWLENPVWTGSTGTLRLLIFLRGEILWYYLYLCFRGRGIQWTHFHIHIAIAWPRKSIPNRKYWNFKVAHISQTGFFRSTGGGRILKLSPLNSSLENINIGNILKFHQRKRWVTSKFQYFRFKLDF